MLTRQSEIVVSRKILRGWQDTVQQMVIDIKTGFPQDAWARALPLIRSLRWAERRK